jgi:ribosomal protein L11 methylase PrmA
VSRESLPSSFRDPSGFLFQREGALYRQVNPCYGEEYELLMKSGLYESLVGDGLLVAHAEVPKAAAPDAFRVLKPDPVPFISYPYEWSFGELQAAALTTLEIHRRALSRGMALKDASAYNIQFRGSRPLLVDTLSFERLRPEEPWTAYRQFCQHFLAPLALMSRRDVRLSQLLRVYIDGVPLDLASELLPGRSRLSFGLLTHLHLHAKSQIRYADEGSLPASGKRKMGRHGLEALLSSLEGTVRALDWEPAGAWVDYYGHTNYTAAAASEKKRIVSEWLRESAPATVWDLGANVGEFSRAAAEAGAYTIAFDSDAGAVERNYREGRERGEEQILPLVLDLTNPSGGIGWANRERSSLVERGPADVALALALIHHLAIGNNVPFARIAEFLAAVCRTLVIEFVPKTDSQVRRMLATREDVFADYGIEAFEREFARRFRTISRFPIPESERVLYRMRRVA